MVSSQSKMKTSFRKWVTVLIFFARSFLFVESGHELQSGEVAVAYVF